MGKQPEDSNVQAKKDRDKKEVNVFIATTSDRPQKYNARVPRRL
jgi:hypothetical protein